MADKNGTCFCKKNWKLIVGAALFVLFLILIVLLMINNKLKYFRNYDEKEGEQFKLHFRGMSRK